MWAALRRRCGLCKQHLHEALAVYASPTAFDNHGALVSGETVRMPALRNQAMPQGEVDTEPLSTWYSLVSSSCSRSRRYDSAPNARKQRITCPRISLHRRCDLLCVGVNIGITHCFRHHAQIIILSSFTHVLPVSATWSKHMSIVPRARERRRGRAPRVHARARASLSQLTESSTTGGRGPKRCAKKSSATPSSNSASAAAASSAAPEKDDAWSRRHRRPAAAMVMVKPKAAAAP